MGVKMHIRVWPLYVISNDIDTYKDTISPGP